MIAVRLRSHLPTFVFLVTAVIAVYGRTLGHDFLINWDDNVYVTANSSIQGFSVENIRALFTNYYAGNYAPLQMFSYMLDYTLWGLWPGGFLLTNVILHTFNGLLLYGIIFKSYGDRQLAGVAAAIFLLHPVQVESVAWISQRKNLLAMLFMLLAWIAYLCYRESAGIERRLTYAIAVAAFLCSLLAKSAAVFFPVALFLYDYCFPVRGQKVRVVDKIPFLLLAIAAAFLAILSQSPDVKGFSGMDFGGRAPWHGGSPWATFLTMLPVFCSYLKLMIWPAGLSALYNPVVYRSLEMPVIAAFILLSVLGFFSCRLCRHNLRNGYWSLFFILAILPVSQLIPLVTIMNDRYLYFPLIGFAVLSGVGAVALRDRLSLKGSQGVLILLIGVLTAISFQRAGVWKNSKTLWSDAVEKVPGKFEAWEGLGEAYHQIEPISLKSAEYAYSRAFTIYSSGPNNLFNLARVKIAQGDEAQGLTLLQRLLKVNSEYVVGWVTLGDIWLGRSDFRQAEAAYLQAEKLQPEAIEVNIKLLELYSATKNIGKAVFYAKQVERLNGQSRELNP